MPGGSKPAGPCVGLVMRLGGRRPALCLLVGLRDAAAKCQGQVPSTLLWDPLAPSGRWRRQDAG